MQQISVNVKDKYEIFIGDISQQISSISFAYNKILIVSDSNVAKTWLDSFVDNLKDKPSTFIFEAGETSKSFDTYQNILSKLIEDNFSRNDLIIGFGGGVVGDIVGFVASTYKRGMDYILVPTSLLSMIDSCVGGKCGINYKGYKNYVGTFYQPKAVYVNPKYLTSLPIDELNNGLGEAFKYSVLTGNPFIDLNINDEELIEDFIYDCLSYKASIVEMDEKDSFERKLLNLGHTIGHAIEEDSNYTIKHGIAVANGVYMMAKASYLNNRLSKESMDKIENAFMSLGMEECYFESKEEIKKYIEKDKKSTSDGDIDVVLVSGIGDCNIARMSVDSFVEYISKSAVYIV